MFGMLDYRAYKLFWLIGLSFRIAARLLFFVAIGAGVIFARWTELHPPIVQMVVAYIAFEIIGLIITAFWTLLIMTPLDKALFWVVDVIPSRGEDMTEARAVARIGPAVWLTKKFMNDIGNWTWEDSAAYGNLLNWRSKLFFHGPERVAKRVQILQEAYENTGLQPAELGDVEVKKLLKPYKDNWFETVIMTPHSFNAIIGAGIIIWAIAYLDSNEMNKKLPPFSRAWRCLAAQGSYRECIAILPSDLERHSVRRYEGRRTQ
jgi:hypothetical protein